MTAITPQPEPRLLGRLRTGSGRTPGTAAGERPRRLRIAYLAVTAMVVGEAAIGGAMDLFRMSPFYPTMLNLGYPDYFATILGVAKILAAIVLVAPGLPRLKEWAYAGVVINMTGAAASNLAMHQPVAALIAPAVFVGLAILSWALRPPTRRL